MEHNAAQEALAQASALETSARRGSRWLVGWYIIFGVATLVVASILAYVPGPVGMVTFIVFWGLVVAGLSVYAGTRKTAMRNMGKVHGAVIGAWGGAWALTVALGVTIGQLGYLLGGVACFLICLFGAWYVHRKTS